MADSPPYSLSELLGLLDLEQLERDLFRGGHGPGSHVFGGQVMAQAIVAAARTTEDRRLHSVHSYFLRPGDSTRPVVFEVDRIRDGRSFSTRRVLGIQRGRAIFSLSASFQTEEEGFEHQHPFPRVQPPEDLPEDHDHYQRLARDEPRFHRFLFRFDVVDSRQAEGIHMFPREERESLPPSKNTWMRIRGDLATVDEPLHCALLAYLSDMDFLGVALLPHGPDLAGRDLQVTSLDHALWFHRSPKVDDWLLFSKESTSSSGSRGFVRGSFFTRDGRLVASVMQECLMRLRPKA